MRGTSQARIEANRRNAQKSTGPRTDEGKDRSKLNAGRHHLTGQVTTMADPDREAYNKFLKGIMKSLAPEGEQEIQLAQRIAHDQWRLNRAAAIEDNIFAMGFGTPVEDNIGRHPEINDAFTTAWTFQKQARNLQLLTLYEQRLTRSLHKNMALLKQLQTEREAKHQAAMEEAKQLLQLSEIRNLPYDPAKDGFVFSKAEIYDSIDRDQRLRSAHESNFRRFKPRNFPPEAAQAA
jgi:hypothetical protein